MGERKVGTSANQIPLWRQTLGTRNKDAYSAERNRLEVALLSMSDKVEDLLKNIPSDCRGLTLHDITHLDAVWEMASLIAGEDYPLNPAEAFVLGASILVHDAGLTVASYQGGIDDLIGTVEWQDAAANELARRSLEINETNIKYPPAECRPSVIFSTLRAVHARQAERLVTQPWILGNATSIYLLEDLELRQAFGEAIGRIAHSHHWSIERVANELRDSIGVSTFLPPEWSVNERKIACILRCADAAHIDRRRAPTISFAATKPVSLSYTHWSAQNRINKPSVDKSTMVYTAGASYPVEEAESWWLSYDLIKLVDSEIRTSNALLEEIGQSRLRVLRVAGADSPRSLSKQIKTEGWQPIDAEVRVSDPIHLAKTLGGRHLYGTDSVAPIREMLQNAVDAIRARRLLEDRGLEFGTIDILIEPDQLSSDGCIVHVDDDGIGMTERVMSGPLIDFGKSIWSSGLLQSEFPGLQSKGIKPIGKYGIGFFSVFELADHVKVVSNHFEQGLAEAKVLEFKSLNHRPHIRPAVLKELPRDKSTRVSLYVKDKRRVSGIIDQGVLNPRLSPFRINQINSRFADILVRMIAMLDVRVRYQNKIDGTTFEHSPDAYGIDADEFLDEVLANIDDKSRENLKRIHGPLVDNLVDESGRKYGRAALLIGQGTNIRQHRALIEGQVAVGGFSYVGSRVGRFQYVGVIEGKTEEAARKIAVSVVPDEVVANWASSQAKLIDQSKYGKSGLISMCETIISIEGDPSNLPYCFCNGNLIDYASSLHRIKQQEEIFILLDQKYSTSFATRPHSLLRAVYFDLKTIAKVFAVGYSSDDIIDDEEVFKQITKDDISEISKSDISGKSESLDLFVNTVTKAWGAPPGMLIEKRQVFEPIVYDLPPEQWVLIFRKP